MKRNSLFGLCACLLCALIIAQCGFVTATAACEHPAESMIFLPGNGLQCGACGEILLAPEGGDPVVPPEPVVPAECQHLNVTTLAPVAPTCVKTGLTSGLKCADCGQVLLAQEVVPATGDHKATFVDGKAPTCGATGLTEGVVCADCGLVLLAQEVVPATGKHTEEVIPAVPATCAKTGLTEGKKCTVCGEVTVKQEVVPVNDNHTEEVIPAVPATCGKAGLTEGKVCTVCGKTTVKQEVVPATGKHTEVVIPAVEANCMRPGLSEGKECSVCGEILVPQVNLGLGNHKMENGVCTICGYKTPGSSNSGLDNVPKTGDITGVVLQSAVVLFGLLGISALTLKRKLTV